MIKIFLISMSICLGVSVSARAEINPDNGKKEILKDLKIEVKKDVVMILSKNGDSSLVRTFESKSPNLILTSDSEAKVYLEGQWYLARMTESEFSDGGDLDNLELFDAAGQVVATRTNVSAFDSVVLAMTGGDQHFDTKTQP